MSLRIHRDKRSDKKERAKRRIRPRHINRAGPHADKKKKEEARLWLEEARSAE
jgi:hypothetical protein